jgi:hypothetical protein
VGALFGACGQWSSLHPRLGTLMRHVVCSLGTPSPPSSRARRMRLPAALRALVAPGGLAPRRLPGFAPAATAAIAVAPVAVTAQQHLRSATRAHEQAARTLLHAPSQPKVLDGLVRGEPHWRGTAFIGTV